MTQATMGRAITRAVVTAVLAGMVLYLCNLIAVMVLAPSTHMDPLTFVAPWTVLVMVAGTALGYPLDFTVALHAGVLGLGLVTVALFLVFLLAALWRSGRRRAVAGVLLALVVAQVPVRMVTRVPRQRAACQVVLDTAFFARQPSAATMQQAVASCTPLADGLDPAERDRLNALVALQEYAAGDPQAATRRLAALLRPDADPVTLRRNLEILLDHGQAALVARFTDAYVTHFTELDHLPKRWAFDRIAIAAHARLGEWDAALATLSALERDVGATSTSDKRRAPFVAENARLRAELQAHRVPAGL